MCVDEREGGMEGGWVSDRYQALNVAELMKDPGSYTESDYFKTIKAIHMHVFVCVCVCVYACV